MHEACHPWLKELRDIITHLNIPAEGSLKGPIAGILADTGTRMAFLRATR
jgi:hypothetical protein